MKMAKSGVILIAIVVLLCAGLGRSAASSGRNVPFSQTTEVKFPDLTGSYKVGRVAYEWVDQSRDETYASIPGLKRDLMVDVWFPANPAKRAKVVPYMEDSAMWKFVIGNPDLESTVHARAYITNSVAEDKPSYPVLLFEPNSTIPSFYYTSIIEELASHGYIVVGISHPYNTAAVSYPDGRIVGEKTGGAGRPSSMDDMRVRILMGQDIHFILDQLEKLNESDEAFKGHLDMTNIGIMGHFYGGLIALLSATSEARIKAGASLEMDPATQMNPPNKPFLYLGIGAAPRASLQTQDTYWTYSNAMSISNFGDFALLQPTVPVPADQRVYGSIDPTHGVQIINNYLLSFFDHYLNGADLKWPGGDEMKVVTFPMDVATATN